MATKLIVNSGSWAGAWGTYWAGSWGIWGYAADGTPIEVDEWPHGHPDGKGRGKAKHHRIEDEATYEHSLARGKVGRILYADKKTPLPDAPLDSAPVPPPLSPRKAEFKPQSSLRVPAASFSVVPNITPQLSANQANVKVAISESLSMLRRQREEDLALVLILAEAA